MRNTVAILLAVFCCSVALASEEISIAPPHPLSKLVDGDTIGGFKIPGFDDTHIQEPYDLYTKGVIAEDWRAYASPCGSQGACGTCWIFAALGDFEMQDNINGSVLRYLSEDHLKECNIWGTQCAGGGNIYMSSNYLTKEGPRLESCQPYHAYNYHCVTSCDPVRRLRQWRNIANTESAVKAALIDGPVITSMDADAWGSAFDTYSGGILVGGTFVAQNHAVVIVGWDTVGGTGDYWIVRNSWGTGWGIAGYFYVDCDSPAIVYSSGQFTDFEDPLDSQDLELIYFDDHGVTSNLGYGATTAWGAVEVTPTYDGYLERIEFINVEANFTYILRVYDNRSGSTLYTELYTDTVSGNAYAGYYSIDVNPPLAISNGDTIYVCVRFESPGWNWPIPIDDTGVVNGNSYTSYTGGTGSWSAYAADVCIRAVCSEEVAGTPTPTAGPNETPTLSQTSIIFTLLIMGILMIIPLFRKQTV